MKRFTIFAVVLLLFGTRPGLGQTGGAERLNINRSAVGMVCIPAGTFQPFLSINSQPKTLTMHAFYLDVHAVTNAEFLAFVKVNPQWARSKVSPLFADPNYLSHWAGDFKIGAEAIYNSPVVNISWFAAAAYAKWCGKRLPTLQEWEYAGAGKLATGAGSRKLSSIILDWYSRPTPERIPAVASTFKNEYGLFDMHGLVWEWVADFNRVITGPDSRSAGNLNENLFCASASLNVRDKEDYAAFMRFAFRESLKASYTIANLGFRCAMDRAKGK